MRTSKLHTHTRHCTEMTYPNSVRAPRDSPSPPQGRHLQTNLPLHELTLKKQRPSSPCPDLFVCFLGHMSPARSAWMPSAEVGSGSPCWRWTSIASTSRAARRARPAARRGRRRWSSPWKPRLGERRVRVGSPLLELLASPSLYQCPSDRSRFWPASSAGQRLSWLQIPSIAGSIFRKAGRKKAFVDEWGPRMNTFPNQRNIFFGLVARGSKLWVHPSRRGVMI